MHGIGTDHSQETSPLNVAALGDDRMQYTYVYIAKKNNYYMEYFSQGLFNYHKTTRTLDFVVLHYNFDFS